MCLLILCKWSKLEAQPRGEKKEVKKKLGIKKRHRRRARRNKQKRNRVPHFFTALSDCFKQNKQNKELPAEATSQSIQVNEYPIVVLPS